jgi:hypothetical protein
MHEELEDTQGGPSTSLLVSLLERQALFHEQSATQIGCFTRSALSTIIICRHVVLSMRPCLRVGCYHQIMSLRRTYEYHSAKGMSGLTTRDLETIF